MLKAFDIGYITILLDKISPCKKEYPKGPFLDPYCSLNNSTINCINDDLNFLYSNSVLSAFEPDKIVLRGICT